MSVIYMTVWPIYVVVTYLCCGDLYMSQWPIMSLLFPTDMLQLWWWDRRWGTRCIRPEVCRWWVWTWWQQWRYLLASSMLYMLRVRRTARRPCLLSQRWRHLLPTPLRTTVETSLCGLWWGKTAISLPTICIFICKDIFTNIPLGFVLMNEDLL